MKKKKIDTRLKSFEPTIPSTRPQKSMSFEKWGGSGLPVT